MANNLAADSQSLDALRLQAKQEPDKALKLAAKQFETVFMNMMLKAMREATPQDGVFDSEQTRMFTSMLDQQLAENMGNRGMGLADIMVRQLSPKATPAASAVPPAALASPIAAASIATLAVAQSTASKRAELHAGVDATKVSLPSAYKESVQQDFVQRLQPYAEQASRETGIPAHLMLGQAALESGWGKRAIRTAEGADSYNLFGIKAGSNWKGRVAEVKTTEYYNGVASKPTEKFRAYDSYADAFRDYASLLLGNPRYAGALQQDNAQGFARALQNSGYATDPKYADKLVKVINRVHTLA
jgi:flagellar protein FlgJ